MWVQRGVGSKNAQDQNQRTFIGGFHFPFRALKQYDTRTMRGLTMKIN